MKRHLFIGAMLGAAALPVTGIANPKRITPQTQKGFKANAGEGRIHGHIKLKGVNANILDVKVSGSDTNGALAIFEQTSLTPGKGVPLHVHHNQDEVFYVVEGNYFFKVGDDTYNMAAGDTIFLPKTVPHAWTQVSNTGKMVVLFQPAGKMENFFVTVSALQTEPTLQEMAILFADNDMQIVGPPLKAA